MFARRANFYKFDEIRVYIIFLLILKCLAGKNCCVTIVVGSKNMWKEKIAKVKSKEIKLDLAYEIFYHPYDHCA